MEQTLFTYLKGVGFLVGLVLLFYPLILLFQLVTGTLGASLPQVGVLFALSLLAWGWMAYLYRNANLETLGIKAVE